ncbi:MAG TPA: hypothetical protein VFB33_05510 [Candidatus Binataceae bacterium]|nr:hypothetical protein [Candidatus Binataceae bacterium]
MALVQRSAPLVEIRRLLGELAAAAGELDSVQAYLHDAIEVARAREAKSWELRAATSIARLMRARGRVAQARAPLAPVYEWFSESLPSTNFCAARMLLGELPE